MLGSVSAGQTEQEHFINVSDIPCFLSAGMNGNGGKNCPGLCSRASALCWCSAVGCGLHLWAAA